MSGNTEPTPPQTSGELDLRELLRMIRAGGDNLANTLLRFFLFLKRNLILLFILAVVGLLLGYGLKLITGTRYKLDVIVSPNLESRNYLYDIVDELDANITGRDTLFFNQLEVPVSDLKDFRIEINSLNAENVNRYEDEARFLELLLEFENTDAIDDIVRAHLMDRGTMDQRITFYFPHPESGRRTAEKIIAYINSNAYYQELVETYSENARERIRQNDSVIAQIDVLIENFTDQMARENRVPDGQLVLENEETLAVADLLELKSNLVRDSENKRVELKRRQEAISVINFGKARILKESFFKRSIFYMPAALILGFLLITLLRILDRKARALERNPE